MNQHSSIKEIYANQELIDKCIEVRGWVRNRRDSKAGISFLEIHDGSCFNSIQAIASNTLENYTTEILKLTKDCSVEVIGKLIESRGKGQSVEIDITQIKVIGWIENPETYPVSPKRHTVEYLREHPHLRVRTNLFGAIARTRQTVSHAIHDFFHRDDFIWVNTPIITASDCEGAGEQFQVSTLDYNNLPLTKNKVDYKEDFFNQNVYLTVSGQLNAEAYCSALSKVYTFGPTFRAENSNTSRHLAEFWMVEPEIAFANLTDAANLAESLLKHVIQTTLLERKDDIEFFNKFVSKGLIDRLSHVLNTEFIRMDYSDAIAILKDSNKKFNFPVTWGLDLQSEHERYLCEEYAQCPVILMNYPKEIKAFYMRMNDDNKTVAAMDVLVPGIGELIGGAQREERLDKLDARANELNMNIDSLAWYRDLRKYGSVPHAGFGLGFERLLGYITGVANVRDLIPFPRTPGNARF